MRTLAATSAASTPSLPLWLLPWTGVKRRLPDAAASAHTADTTSSISALLSFNGWCSLWSHPTDCKPYIDVMDHCKDCILWGFVNNILLQTFAVKNSVAHQPGDKKSLLQESSYNLRTHPEPEQLSTSVQLRHKRFQKGKWMNQTEVKTRHSYFETGVCGSCTKLMSCLNLSAPTGFYPKAPGGCLFNLKVLKWTVKT